MLERNLFTRSGLYWHWHWQHPSIRRSLAKILCVWNGTLSTRTPIRKSANSSFTAPRAWAASSNALPAWFSTLREAPAAGRRTLKEAAASWNRRKPRASSSAPSSIRSKSIRNSTTLTPIRTAAVRSTCAWKGNLPAIAPAITAMLTTRNQKCATWLKKCPDGKRTFYLLSRFQFNLQIVVYIF